MTTTEQIESAQDVPTEKVEVQYWYDLAPYFYFDEAGNKMKAQADTSLLGTKPNFRSDMGVTILEVLGSEDSIVNAARASLKQLAEEFPPEQNAGLVKRLVKDGHGVPLEHALISFHLEVPIFVSRQIVKHRHSSINESSGRYSSAIPDFYVTHPDKPLVQVGKTMDYTFRHAPEDSGIYEAHAHLNRSMAEAAWENYTQQIAAGISKEDARKILPVTAYSKMVVLLNVRSLLNFISKRGFHEDAKVTSHPQWEIAQVSDQMEEALAEHFPNVYASFKENGYLPA